MDLCAVKGAGMDCTYSNKKQAKNDLQNLHAFHFRVRAVLSIPKTTFCIMEKLRQYFESNGFAGEDLEKILRAFTLKTFNKSDFFAEAGKETHHLGYGASGLFQYCVITDGIESTTYVAPQNTFLTSLLGCLNETPARENIRALMRGTVWITTQNAISNLICEIPPFKDFYIALLEWHICAIDNSRNDLLRLTAEQRYEKKLREQPTLLQHLPLQYVASILGVTPRHLSRMRKKTALLINGHLSGRREKHPPTFAPSMNNRRKVVVKTALGPSFKNQIRPTNQITKPL